MSPRHWVVNLERAWDAARLRRAGSRPPANFRIEPYIGHGSADGVVVRGRVLDDPPLSEAVEGEAQASFMRIPFSMHQQFRYAAVNATELDSMPAIQLSQRILDRMAAAGFTVERVDPPADSSVATAWFTMGAAELAQSLEAHRDEWASWEPSLAFQLAYWTWVFVSPPSCTYGSRSASLHPSKRTE